MSVGATEAGAFDRMRETYVAATNSGDADAVAATFTDDGVYMPSNAPASVGGDNIKGSFEAFFGAFRAEFSLAPDEVEIVGAAGHLNAVPTRSPSVLRPAASPFPTLASTSRFTSGSRTVAGRLPGASGTAITRYPECPDSDIGASICWS